MASICNCVVEYRVNPLGMDEPRPRFSYTVEGLRRQKRRRIMVFKGRATGEVMWDSGWVETRETLQIPYEGTSLEPFTRYDWTVFVEGTDGVQAETVVGDNYFETGHLGTPWNAQWIASPWKHTLCAAPARFRKDFSLDGKAIAQARLFITALGLYDAWVNGKIVSDTVFNPGWTQYDKRVQYQAYDVTALLQDGDNALAVRLADGWCCGRIGHDSDFPAVPHIMAELRLTMTDGSVRVIGTDDSWLCAYLPGAIRYSDIYQGEYYEAWRDDEQWKRHGGNGEGTSNASVSADISTHVVWHRGATTRRVRRVYPQQIIPRGNGHWLVDFGQNLVGYEHLRLNNVEKGRVITILHGEMVQNDGSVYTENLRSALATTTLVCSDSAILDYTPHYTFYGFRYLDITGFPTAPTPETLWADVIHSDLETVGDFSCSDPLVNQLYSNIVWGQRGNFVDIPTDCPQRDERLGWTGDTQVFADMATFNMDAPAFYRKWLEDLNLLCGGVFGHICPDPQSSSHLLKNRVFSAWNDAGIIVPWMMYVKYADTRILRDLYPAMKQLLDTQVDMAEGQFVVDNARFGDWLNIDSPTATPYISTAYLAGMTALVADIAAILGDEQEAAARRTRFQAIQKAFLAAFFTPDGDLTVRTQTAALLALHFKLVDGIAKEKAVAFLAEDIREHGTHLSTGFVGTPLLLRTLSDNGLVELAYDLLCQTTYPGWLYPVTQGATTMWERWNSYSNETGFGDVNMNSFNHYAYGAVGSWFFDTICGIRADATAPAFLDFTLAPQFGQRFTHASAAYRSPRGMIRSAWTRRNDGTITWNITIPANTTARVILPADTRCDGVLPERLEAGDYTLRVLL